MVAGSHIADDSRNSLDLGLVMLLMALMTSTILTCLRDLTDRQLQMLMTPALTAAIP